MPPPIRTVPTDFHFYAYDNDVATAWTLGSAQVARQNLRFYAMRNDLTQLAAWGAVQGVPNITTNTIGLPINVGGIAYQTLVLSLGSAAPTAPGVVITGGIHAREWAAPAMAYLFAEYLVRNYQTEPASPKAWALKNLVDSRRIFIAPMLNPHGNMFTVYDPTANARNWRKNRRALPHTSVDWNEALTTFDTPNPPFANVVAPSPDVPNLARYDVPIYGSKGGAESVNIRPTADVGVDLNRNCTTPGFGRHCPPAATSGLPRAEDYFGPMASSEIETRNIEFLLTQEAGRAGGVATSIDYHSYGKYILYPSEASYDRRVNANYTALGQVLQKLIGPRQEGWVWYDYKLGTPMQCVEYDAVGTLGDRAALSHGTRAFVVELDPAAGDPAGFELPEAQIQTVFEKNIRGALALVAAAGGTSTVQHSWMRTRTVTSAESQFLSWDVYGRGNQLPP